MILVRKLNYENRLVMPDNQTGMNPSNKILFLIIAVLLIFFLVTSIAYAFLSSPQGTPIAEPVTATEDPVQVMLPATEPIIWSDEDYSWEMVPRATYHIAARVIRRKRYTDWESKFIPWDLALGWGQVSDPQMDEWMTWKQSNRSLSATWIGPLPLPFPEEYIRDHAANVHIIPATDNLKLAFASLKDNDLVLLEGLLVDAEGGPEDEIKIFRTSLTRTDLAPGGCELMYVERLVVGGMEYR